MLKESKMYALARKDSLAKVMLYLVKVTDERVKISVSSKDALKYPTKGEALFALRDMIDRNPGTNAYKAVRV